jgi:predicted nucleotidyltransferase
MLARRPPCRQASSLPDFSPYRRCGIFLIWIAGDAVATLRRHESELRARGVAHAAVFGSVARGDHRPGSDLDIMIDIAPEAALTVYGYVGLREYIASLFDGPVDVVTRDALKPYLRPTATTDAISAF